MTIPTEPERARASLGRKDVGSNPGVLEFTFALGSLLFFTDAVRVLLMNPGGQGTVSLAADPFSKPALVAIYATTIALLLLRWRQSLASARRIPLILAVVAFALASTSWSTDSAVTLKNAIWLVGSTLFGVYLAQRYQIRATLSLLIIASTLVVLGSVAFIVFLPELGTDPGLHANAWRGVFAHKNSFGRMMVLASIIFLVAAATYRRYLPLFACLLVLSLGLIVQSKSASSVLIAAGLLGISTVALFIRRLNISRLGSAMMLLAMTATLAAVASIGAEQILGILGKDSSLTGRTVLWATVAAELIDRPLLGFGFQAFWLGNTAEFATVWSVVRWAPPNAHNGYLDVALSLGLTGLLLVLITIVATGSKVVAMAASVARDNSRYLPALIFAYFLLSNAGESALVQQNHILWVLFVWASLASQPEPALQPAVVAAR